jgi:hypothetical protein
MVLVVATKNESGYSVLVRQNKWHSVFDFDDGREPIREVKNARRIGWTVATRRVFLSDDKLPSSSLVPEGKNAALLDNTNQLYSTTYIFTNVTLSTHVQ